MTISQDSSHPTGVVDTSPRGSSGAARARMRKARAALDLKRDSYTWDQIAEALGFPTGRAALVACELALEEDLLTSESQEFMRQIAAERLERILRPLMKVATNPEHPNWLSAVAQARSIIAEHADVMGFRAPKRSVVVSPTQSQIEQWVAMITKMDAPPVQELDIFDDEQGWDEEAEVVDEEEPDAASS